MSVSENKESEVQKEHMGRHTSRFMSVIYVLIVLTVAVNIIFVLNRICHIDILGFFKDLFMLKYLPSLGSKTSFGLLFVFGLLTSFHCIGMCGGIAISQSLGSSGGEKTARHGTITYAGLYNLGRVISYTAVGALVGGLGQIISFRGIWKSFIPILGGTFMIVMAINLLGIFPFLRKFNLPVPRFFAKKVFSGKRSYSPFIVGLFTGLMPCGPLQMMQLYALGTKSSFYGAVSLLVFSLGTIPLLFIFGTLNTFINKKHSKTILKISATLVLILGFVMIRRGLALAGVNIELPSFLNLNSSASIEYTAKISGNLQTVDTELLSDSFPVITVQKGIPVKWDLHALKKNYNDCNNAIVIPDLGIEKEIEVGDNFIEFIPEKTGTINYTCWMGMIKSKIKVVDHIVKGGGEK